MLYLTMSRGDVIQVGDHLIQFVKKRGTQITIGFVSLGEPGSQVNRKAEFMDSDVLAKARELKQKWESHNLEITP